MNGGWTCGAQLRGLQHSQIQSLTLQAPYLLYVDNGSGRESVPLEQ